MTEPDKLKVALLTREYPPEVYGGAGVHVEYLARELAPFVDLTVHCQGKPRTTAVAHSPWSLLSESNSAKLAPTRCIAMNAGASWAFIDTVWASPTFSRVGTKTFVMTVRAIQPSTMGTASTRIACAILERSAVGAPIGVFTSSPAPSIRPEHRPTEKPHA